MDNYHYFAYFYDSLMSDSFYEDYLSFLMSNITSKRVLELGCGTGTLAIALAKLGKSVVASDISTSMLAIAKEKMKEEEVTLSFLHLDMRSFCLEETFDTILCLCDSLNYLSSVEEVSQMFTLVYQHLETQGYFVFDVHSLYKIDTIFKQYKEEEETEDDYFYWQVKKIEEGKIEHLVIIEDKENDLRVEEKHQQLTFSTATYMRLLKEAGFKDIQIFGEFEALHEKSYRNIFIVRK